MSIHTLGRRLMIHAYLHRAGQPVRKALLIGRPLEQLEDRTVPAIAVPDYLLAGGFKADGSSAPPTGALTPTELAGAYGINQITAGGIRQEGAGQTVAIIDAYDDPDMVSSTSPTFDTSDLHLFDEEYGLPEPAGFFTKVNESGGTTYPAANRSWSLEISLDVEWVHALAPLADIILVESATSNTSDLLDQAAVWAATDSPATVVTMSFSVTGGFEGESAYDEDFESPAGKGVTFFASTGDTSVPAGYPAESDNVVAVGGTTLSVTAGGQYSSESVWGDGKDGAEGGGGGISKYEPAPAFQDGLVIHNGSSTVNAHGYRATPDVAFDANPSSGVAVIDSYYVANGAADPWYQVGGTSLSSPSWAAIMSIVDELRADDGLGSLDGSSQTLPDLYAIYNNAAEYADDFHDISTGSNGYSAGPGYDLGSGIGTPIANNLAFGLAGITSGLTATLDASGGLVVADTLGYTDNMTVEVSGSNYVITDAAQAFNPADVPAGTTLSNNNQTLTIPIALTGLTSNLDFELGGGDNSLTVDYAGGNFSNPIEYNGGTGTSDGLVVEGSGTQSVTYTPSGSTPGSASITSHLSITRWGLPALPLKKAQNRVS